jgi:hypothetical protein
VPGQLQLWQVSAKIESGQCQSQTSSTMRGECWPSRRPCRAVGARQGRWVMFRGQPDIQAQRNPIGSLTDYRSWRLRPIFRRPLFRKRWQWRFFAGHALNGNGKHGNVIDPREEALGPLGFRLAVFCHQRFAEPLLGFPVFGDPYPAAHTSIGETRIAFKPAIIKDAFLLIDLKANAPLNECGQAASHLAAGP